MNQKTETSRKYISTKLKGVPGLGEKVVATGEARDRGRHVG